MDPQQELFIKLKTEIEKLGYRVFDGELPPENTPYPFVYLGDFRQTDTILKNAVIGNIYPTIHVWHNSSKKRGTVSRMLLEMKGICHEIERTDCKWMLTDVTQNIMSDNSTKSPLVHGVLEVTFKFS